VNGSEPATPKVDDSLEFIIAESNPDLIFADIFRYT
jgi:hypothetical protein